MIPYQFAKSLAVERMKPMTGAELFIEISAAFPPREFCDGLPTRFVNHPCPETIEQYGKTAAHWFRACRVEPARKLNFYTYNSRKAAVVYYFKSKFNRLLVGYQKSRTAYEGASDQMLLGLQEIFRTLQVIEGMNFKSFADWISSITGSDLGPMVVPKGATSKKRTVACLPKNFQSLLFDATSDDNTNRSVTAIGLLSGARCAEFPLGIVVRRTSESSLELTIPCAKDRHSTGRVRVVNLQICDPWSRHLGACVPEVGDKATVKRSAKSVSELGRRLNQFLEMPTDRKFSFYTLRHHFVAALRQQGMHPGEIAVLAGHQSLNAQYCYGTDDKRCKVKLIEIALTEAQKLQADSIRFAASQYEYRRREDSGDGDNNDRHGDRPGSGG